MIHGHPNGTSRFCLAQAPRSLPHVSLPCMHAGPPSPFEFRVHCTLRSQDLVARPCNTQCLYLCFTSSVRDMQARKGEAAEVGRSDARGARGQKARVWLRRAAAVRHGMENCWAVPSPAQSPQTAAAAAAAEPTPWQHSTPVAGPGTHRAAAVSCSPEKEQRSNSVTCC